MHTGTIIPIETYFSLFTATYLVASGAFGHIIEKSTIISSYKLIVSVQSVLEEKLVA